MKVIRQKCIVQDNRRWPSGVFVFFLLIALGMNRASAQPESAAPEDQPDGGAEQSEAILADEEITVVGQRSLRLLRLEVQLERERVYGLFNSLNSDDQFDIHCGSVPRTGTRIPQRVCRPQFTDSATGDAGGDFVRELQRCGGLSEACLESGRSMAQAELSVVSVRDRELAAEVERLTRENPEFRRAIAGYQAVERRYEDARRTVASELRISASILEPVSDAIPSSLTAGHDEVVPPTAIELVTNELAAPEALWRGPGQGVLREAWVKLRFSVMADGTIADVTAVDAMPSGLDASSVMDAVQAWTFEPARADGVPIDWHNNLAVVVFNRERATHEGWPDFADAYEAVAALVADARYEEARSQNERMRSELAVTFEEMAFAEMQRAAIEHALGDPYAALDAIRRATEPAVDKLANEELTLALGHRFTLEFELGLAADALQTYQRRTALGRLPSRDPMARSAAALEQALGMPETGLAAQSQIDGGGQSEHRLTWGIFGVGDVDGRIDGLEIVCNRNKTRLPVEADVQMSIPAGWGECVLFVGGQPDTTFIVYEFQTLVD
jgi:hypothetical protein